MCTHMTTLLSFTTRNMWISNQFSTWFEKTLRILWSETCRTNLQISKVAKVIWSYCWIWSPFNSTLTCNERALQANLLKFILISITELICILAYDCIQFSVVAVLLSISLKCRRSRKQFWNAFKIIFSCKLLFVSFQWTQKGFWLVQ